MSLNKEETIKNVTANWESWFVPALSDFVRIPNLTTMVDPDYLTNGLVQKAMEEVDQYINKLEVQNISK
jgi:hypothetical protein